MTAPAHSSSASQHEPDTIFWESLNSSYIVEHDAATKDLIGAGDPLGIEIETNGNDFEFREEKLDDDNIQTWIRRHPISDTTRSRGNGSILRVLLLNRVVYGDHQRPPAEAEAVRFSREDLYTYFGCSPLALEKVSRNQAWTGDFPRDQRAGRNITCTGLGTTDFSMIWMQNANRDSGWTIIKFEGPNSGCRSRFVKELRRLRSLYEQPELLPFVAISASIWATECRMDYHLEDIQRSNLRLQRFPDESTANEVYFASLTVAGSLESTKRHAKAMDKMVDKCLNMKTPAKVRSNPTLANRAAGLKAAFSYQKQQLRAVIDDAEYGLGYSSRQIECVLSIMAQRQQQLSIEIAQTQSKLAEASRREQAISVEISKASKTIAEETKKDGASMKTLAVVTLVYLPCTTVSSVLAMPLFHWDADDQRIVNPRIWVFFVFAIPLTITTIVIWQLWLRYPLNRKVESVETDAASVGDLSLP